MLSKIITHALRINCLLSSAVTTPLPGFSLQPSTAGIHVKCRGIVSVSFH